MTTKKTDSLTETESVPLRAFQDPANLMLSTPVLPPSTRFSSSSASSGLDWRARLDALMPHFAERAPEHDANDAFVSRNYEQLSAARLFSIGIPTELGGSGASYPELCQAVKTIARSCSSTGLAVAMHYHLVAGLVWKLRHQNAPVADFLQGIAREELILVSSGGSDWLQSSGVAQPVLGGYKVIARKVFSSGSPAGHLLMTSAVFSDPQTGPVVLHFAVPLNSPRIRVLSNWRGHGMRGTGSNDILLDAIFVPESAITLRRPQGRWHPAMHLISKISLPLIYSAYTGIAEAAREIALRESRSKLGQPETLLIAGEMENQLFNTRLAHDRMVQLGAENPPGPETTNALLMARTLLAQSAINTVAKAVELVGGRAFQRDLPLERLQRDVQGARFHPLPEKPQQQFSARVAYNLGLDAV